MKNLRHLVPTNLCIAVTALASIAGCDDADRARQDAGPSQAEECQQDSDCVLAVDWSVCGACMDAYPRAEVESDTCTGIVQNGQLNRPLPAPGVCAECVGNEDCALLNPPERALCVSEPDGHHRCAAQYPDAGLEDP